MSFAVASPAPTIQATPSGEVEEETLVTLVCSVTHARPGATLQWFRGQYEEVHGVFTNATSYHDSSTNTIEVRAQPSQHGVTYRCVAYNIHNHHHMTSAYAVTVLCEKLLFTTFPHAHLILLNDVWLVAQSIPLFVFFLAMLTSLPSIEWLRKARRRSNVMQQRILTWWVVFGKTTLVRICPQTSPYHLDALQVPIVKCSRDTLNSGLF